MTSAVASLDDVSVWARSNLLEIVLFICGAVLLARVVNWIAQQINDRADARASESDALVRSEAAKHRHAVIQVLNWVTVVLIYCITAIIVVQKLGIPLSGLVAPATVAGVALGFGAQRIVQDILAGFFLITERQYGFGDVVRISALGSTTGVSGTVEDVTLRLTRLRSVNGEVIIVPNGQIVQVTNLSRDWARAVVDVPLPLSVDVSKVNDLLRQVGDEAYADDKLRPLLLDEPTVMGIESLEMDQLNVRLVARTLPGKQFDVGRELRARVAIAFRHAGITVPAGLDTAAPTGAAS
jgi:moderate conductance mechanosensitive channel